MAVIARTAAVIRGLVLAYIVVQVLIWPPFYAARPVRLAGPAVAAACCAAAVGNRVPALAGVGAGLLGEDWPDVPVPVATALAHAVREALANVASHAGTGEAWVELRSGVADGTLNLADPAVQERCARHPGWRAAVDIDETGAGCLEVRWRKEEAA